MLIRVRSCFLLHGHDLGLQAASTREGFQQAFRVGVTRLNLQSPLRRSPRLLPAFFQRLLPVSTFAPMLLATTADTVVSSDASFSLSSLFSDASVVTCFSSSEHLFL